MLSSFLNKSASNELKRAPLLPAFAACLLLCAFDSVAEWPLEFVQLLVEDTLGEHVWVDSEYAKKFVANVCTVFATTPGASANVPSAIGEVVEEEMEIESSGAAPAPGPPTTATLNATAPSLPSRYPSDGVKDRVKQYVIDMIQHQIKWEPRNVKNVIRITSMAIGYPEVRLIACEHIDEWMNNPTIMRHAKDLLVKVCEHVKDNSEIDRSCVQQILGLRLQTMQSQLYLDCLRRLLKNNSEYAGLVIRYMLTADMQPQRTGNNIKTLSLLTSSIPLLEQELAFILQELAADSTLRPHLKGLLRRVVMGLRNLDCLKLARGLMESRPEMSDQPQQIKDDWVTIVCLNNEQPYVIW